MTKSKALLPDCDNLANIIFRAGHKSSGVRADAGGNGAADEREEQVVKEGEGGSTDGAAKEEAKVED